MSTDDRGAYRRPRRIPQARGGLFFATSLSPDQLATLPRRLALARFPRVGRRVSGRIIGSHAPTQMHIRRLNLDLWATARAGSAYKTGPPARCSRGEL